MSNGADGEIVVFCFADQEQTEEGEDRGACEVVADLLKAIVLGEPCSDIGGQRGAQNTGHAKGE
jgi:hypothetical protein